MMETTNFAGVTVERKQPCTMRDGTVLYADIYRPNTTEQLPVLLMRQPYGRAIASTVSHAHPVWYARQGFIVVIQDVRGKWDSEGEYVPFINDAEDGYDTVEWAAALPGSNGKVGMYGFSYQGSTQWAAASAAPPSLKAIAPAMCAADLYHGMFYPHGRFLLREHLPWAYQLARDHARRLGAAEDEQQCAAYMRNPEMLFWKVPLASPEHHPLLEKYFPFYREWLEHESYDAYWQERDWLAKIKEQQHPIPALHIGGWYDVFLMGTYQSYGELRNRPGGEQHRLVLGPWTHIPWGRYAGGYDHGDNADGNIHELQVQWFNYWLKGQGSGIAENITYYEFGSKQWKHLSDVNNAKEIDFVLHSCYKPANGGLGGGRLLLDSELAATEGTEAAEVAGTDGDLFVYDARQPMRLDSYLPLDRKGDQDRYEILVYCSEPMQEELTVYGVPKIEVQYQLLEGKADLVALLSIVNEQGEARLMSVGVNELDGGNATDTVEVAMKPCSFVLPAGSRVRLELTGSAFPLLARHPNQGYSTPNTTEPLEYNIATVAICNNQLRQSTLKLPIYN